ncbi:cytosolic carboxypeptidase 3-like isoform X2 [Photinus pyralis]|uniref:cytosolic carboxypeptidase 3-like isoform X2 n=1 Tax=Photinus pyralis TaxID=7054 RepID=UPI0012678094|nr:cytosolic carboxypeptidase 3-like isoform X2 [Photinus pyralis]
MSDKDADGLCFQNRKLFRKLNIKDPLISNYEVTQHISSQPSLINQLIHMIWDSEEIDFCSCAINMLYSLLCLSNDEEKQLAMKTVNASEHLNILTHCTYNTHAKFCELKEYRDSFPDMQIKLLHTITTIYQVKKCKKLTIAASEATVRFYSLLVTSQTTHKDLMLHLLPVLKIICLNKKNSEILSSQSFFDGLYVCCKLTQKVSTVVLILKLMSRSAVAAQCMSNHRKIINLVTNLVNYNGKRATNKRSLMTILYRVTATSSGLSLFLEADGFNTLFQFFTNCNNNNRLAAIKAYTILYRTVPSHQLPQTTPSISRGYLDEEEEESSEESDLDSDESEEEHQDDDLAEEQSREKNVSEDCESDNMGCFFTELTDVNENFAMQISDSDFSFCQGNITHRVFNPKHMNKQAYPDTLNLKASYEEHYLNSSTNDLSREYLTYKLMNAKGLSDNKYKSKVVYNVDQNIAESEQSLQFDSRFECGNLKCAKQIGSHEYELLLDSDSNSCNGQQWYYFQIGNTTTGVAYTFNIINFLKINSQYNYGMQPLLFSLKDYTTQGIGWRRCGEHIVYHGNNYTDDGCSKQYRTLSFSITFQHSNDTVYLAYHYPYTYTRLLNVISSLTNDSSSSGIFLRITKLCNTASCKNEVPLLTITAPSTPQLSVNRRPFIFITSRVHPGETNSSWIMEGIINFLLDKENEHAKRARELFIFKIIPMLNPDGVILGNTRSGLNGHDLNRCWLRPHRYKCPEIYFTKKLMEYAKRVLRQPVSFYLDIHGHSRKKFFFFYGCNPAMSWNKSDAVYGDVQDILKVFPQMVHGFTPHLRLNDCKYKIQKAKESTGRVVVWREFGIPYSYTLECSYCAGAEKQTINTKILTDIGASIVRAFASMADAAFSTSKCMPILGVDESHLHSFVTTNGETEEN